jgi:hypothetical protein
MSTTMSTRVAAGVTADYLRDLTRRATPTPQARRDPGSRRPKRLGERERAGHADRSAPNVRRSRSVARDRPRAPLVGGPTSFCPADPRE